MLTDFAKSPLSLPGSLGQQRGPRLGAALFVLSLGALLLVAGPARAGKPAAPPVTDIRAIPISAVWAGPATESPPPDLSRALQAAGAKLLPQGALFAAGQVVAAGRQAVAEMHCGEALPALTQAEERLLSEVAVEDARPVLRDIESLILLCADRVGNDAAANRAADRLLMAGGEPPADVQMVLRRYRPGPLFGPSLPPTDVDTTPKGAQVIRDLLTIGGSPASVPGGNPAVDMLDVELPGWRKIHQPLGSGGKLGLGLSSEDRLPVMSDAIAARPIGSAAQARALRQLATFLTGHSPAPPGRVVVFGPQQQGGRAVGGEKLRAVVYDLGQRKWFTPVGDVAAGPSAQQAAQMMDLAQNGAAVAAVPGGTAKKSGNGSVVVDKPSFFQFTKAKWYSWVIAGGVAVLIGGLLIADHYGTNTLTVTASH